MAKPEEKYTRRRLNSSYFTTVVSISLVLFMLGMLGLIVLHARKLSDYVKEIPGIAVDLVNNIEKPLTVIYEGAKGLAKNVVAADGSIAIRVTKDEFCRELIRQFGKPIVSTSANISGTTDPVAFSQIPSVIREGVDYVVDHNRDRIVKARASRIIRLFPGGEFTVIRK